MNLLQRIVREIEWWRLTIIVTWRMVNGRWYVYRDMPDWLVASHAAMDDEFSEELLRLIAMAQSEQKLRVDRAVREAVRLHDEIEKAIKP